MIKFDKDFWIYVSFFVSSIIVGVINLYVWHDRFVGYGAAYGFVVSMFLLLMMFMESSKDKVLSVKSDNVIDVR